MRPFLNQNVSDCIKRIYGLQRKILFFIVGDCVLRGQLTSGPITVEMLKHITYTDTNTVKTALQRVVKKGLILREKGKRGKGGFTNFTISEQIRNAVIDEQRQTNTTNQLVTGWISEKEPISTYSSSTLNTTTTKANNIKDENLNSFNGWEKIDIEPLQNIGFTKSHLVQIIQDEKLSMEIVQDSIYAFSFDLEHNNKIKFLKSPPLNYFMGILRSGKPYAPPANYESPTDKAMRLYLTKKKELDQRRHEMEEEVFNLAFRDWEAGLSNEEKEALLSPEIKNSRLIAGKIAFIRNHFRDVIWETRKEEYFKTEMGM